MFTDRHKNSQRDSHGKIHKIIVACNKSCSSHRNHLNPKKRKSYHIRAIVLYENMSHCRMRRKRTEMIEKNLRRIFGSMRNAAGDWEIRLSNGDSNTLFNVLNVVGVLKSRPGHVWRSDKIWPRRRCEHCALKILRVLNGEEMRLHGEP